MKKQRILHNKDFVLANLAYFIPFETNIKQVKEQKEDGNYEYRIEFKPQSEFGTHIKHSYLRTEPKYTENEIWDRLYAELYKTILGFGIKFVNSPEKIKHALIKIEEDERTD